MSRTEPLNCQALEEYLYFNIPLSKALGITIKEASSQRVIIQAPAHPNINHKKTIFGGSLHAVATLSCWCLAFINLKNLDVSVEIVIQNSQIDYLCPVTTDFYAECLFPPEENWQRFECALLKKGKAKIRLNAKIYQQERLAVDYYGMFAAIKT